MFAKITFFILFLIAEISLGIYSLMISEGLLGRFLFFVLSAFIICALVIKLSSQLLPDDDRRKKILKKNIKKAQ